MSEEQEPKWTVFCRNPATQHVTREYFTELTGKGGATARANELLRRGYKSWIRPYSPPRRYIDIVAERGKDF